MPDESRPPEALADDYRERNQLVALAPHKERDFGPCPDCGHRGGWHLWWRSDVRNAGRWSEAWPRLYGGPAWGDEEVLYEVCMDCGRYLYAVPDGYTLLTQAQIEAWAKEK